MCCGWWGCWRKTKQWDLGWALRVLWVVEVLGAGGAEAGGGAGHALEASKTSSFLTKTKQREVGWALRVLWVVRF